jgi:hypothetical protein
MKDGAPDETVFKAKIVEIVNRAREYSSTGVVRVFGEMASLLVSRNEVAAAHRVEEMWNEIIGACPFVSLLCTYSLNGTGHECLPHPLIRLHSDELRPRERVRQSIYA